MRQVPFSLSLVKLIFVATIITSIGLVLITGATGYFLSKPKIEPGVSSPMVAPTPVAIDETANWKTYRNEEYGFEARYPENWATAPAKTFQYFYPQIYKFPNEVFVTLMIVPADPLVPFKDGEKNLKEIFIGERKFYWKEDELNLMVKEIEYYTLNSDNSKIAEFVLSVVKDNKYLPVMDIENIFNQILSTFRFIETEDETANWKTYRNEKYGYEVEYPARIKQEEIWYKENEEPSFENCRLYMFDECYTSLSVVEFRYIWEEPPFQKDSYPRCYSRFIIKVIENPSSPSLEKLKETFKKSEYITIDDKKGLRRNEFIGLPPGGGGYEDVVYLPRNSRLNLISYIIDRETVGEENIEKCLNEQSNIYNQILSTFKFIEKDETTNWKTYQNEGWKYEVKYPENWNIKESAQIVWVNDLFNENRIFINTYPNYDSGVTLNSILRWVEEMKKVDCEGEVGPCSEIQIHKREKERWTFQNKEIVKVMNKDAWQYNYKNKSGDKVSKIIYTAFVDLKGVQYIFEIELIDTVSDTSLITNQVLFSFRFLE